MQFSFIDLDGQFSTALGARARASINFASIAGVNLPNITLVDLPYSLAPSRSFMDSPFGRAHSATANVALVGAETPSIPGATVRAGVTLNASQTSSLTLDGLSGTILARHESGDFVSAPVSLGASNFLQFDLSKPGVWDLELFDFSLGNTFNSIFGLSATFSAGYGVGICGDLGVDGDTAFGTPFGTIDPCAADEEVSRTTAPLNLLPIDPFALSFNKAGSKLGVITVEEAIVAAIPLPGSLLLLAAGLAGLVAVGRLRHAPSA